MADTRGSEPGSDPLADGIIATGQGVLQQRRALFPGIALLHFKRGEAVGVFVSQ